jgi:polysaccharide deacetylase family protein (PEP-CTERM system associated)
MLGNKRQLNAFTVDLEDWFQGLTSTNPLVDQWPAFESRIEATTRRLLTILSEQNVRATFFVLGYVADSHPGLIEEIAAEGHEIGVHGYFHRFVSRMTAAEFAQELDQTLAAIVRITGITPTGHRAPYFSLNANTPWAFEVLESRGFSYDSSVFPTKNMLYGFPDAPRFPYKVPGHKVVEFPATTLSFAGKKWPIAGGFYNRALPYAVIRHGIHQVNEQGEPAVIYIHPWELDTGQTYDQVTFRERITHYHGRRGLEKKIVQLLTDFHFGTLQDLLAQIEPSLEQRADTMVLTS